MKILYYHRTNRKNYAKMWFGEIQYEKKKSVRCVCVCNKCDGCNK